MNFIFGYTNMYMHIFLCINNVSVMWHFHRSSVPLSKALLSGEFSESTPTAGTLVTQRWLPATCQSGFFFFIPQSLSFHPLLCPPVIPPLPSLTYVTCPHPCAFGLGAEIDRVSSMVTAACGLCERRGRREGERASKSERVWA